MPNHRRRRSAAIGLVLALLTLIAFRQLAGNGFINLDDGGYVVDNPWVREGLTLRSVAWAFTGFGYASNWHPLTWLSHQVDVSLLGLDPRKHHLMSLGLHTASAVLLFVILQMMTGAVWPSAVTSMLFAIHPLHVESVAWIAERKDVLSGLFWFLTMGAYVAYVRRPSVGRYAAVWLLLALGLMAKPMLVTLPLVLLLIDWWPLGRTGTEGPIHSPAAKAAYLILEKVPLLALSAASSVVTYLAQERGGALNLMERWHFKVRAGNAIASYLRYLGKALWPSNLCIHYPLGIPSPWWTAAGGVFLAGVTSLVVWQAKKYPFLAVGWLWYLGTLLPVIGLVQVGSQSFADRYTYLPLTGFFLAVVWGAGLIAGRVRGGEKLMAGAAVVTVIGVLLQVTTIQAGYWKDSLSIFGRALEVTENNYLATSNLGLALLNAGRVGEALTAFREAARIMPDAKAFVNLGNTLERLGRADEAIETYEQALRLDPRSTAALYNLGNALHRRGRLQEAVVRYQEVLRLKAAFPEAYNNLGVTLVGLGRTDEAVTTLETAVRLWPEYATTWLNLGHTRELLERTSEATSAYQAALTYDPSLGDARLLLAKLFSKSGKLIESLGQLEILIRQQPGNAEAYEEAGRVATALGRTGEASSYLARAAELGGRSGNSRRTTARVVNLE